MNTLKLAAFFLFSCIIAVSCSKEKSLDTSKTSSIAFDTATALTGSWKMDMSNYKNQYTFDTVGRLNTLKLNTDHSYYIQGAFYYASVSLCSPFSFAPLGLKMEKGTWSFKNKILYLKPQVISLTPDDSAVSNCPDKNYVTSYNLNYGSKSPSLCDTTGFGNYSIDTISSTKLKLTALSTQVYAICESACDGSSSGFGVYEVKYQFYMSKK